MDRPIILHKEIVCDLPRAAGNPRNSEGDFLCLHDGAILFAYSRYCGADGKDDSPCDIAGLLSRDGGRTFSPLPDLLASASDHGAQNIMCVSLRRLPNGEACLFYLCKYPPLSAYYLRRALREDTPVFGTPEVVFPAEEGVYSVVNNCRVCVTHDGRLLVPAARHAVVREGGREVGGYFADSVLYEADSDGRHWRRLPHLFTLPQPGHSETGLQEPGVVELPGGKLYAYFRTDRAFQYESISDDGGRNWSTPTQSLFTSPESPMLIARNPFSELYYAFWNPIPLYNGRIAPDAPWIDAGRTPFVMAVSKDGTSFSPFTVLEDDPTRGYCYPAVHFLGEKEMLLSYCCGGPDDGMCLTRTRIVRAELA